MKIFEVVEPMDQATRQKKIQTLNKLNAQAKGITDKLASGGEVDNNKDLPVLYNLMKEVTSMNMIAEFKGVVQAMMAKIKEGLDSYLYGKRHDYVQGIYDELAATIPQLEKQAAQYDKEVVQPGKQVKLGRMDVPETTTTASSIATSVGNVGGKPQSRTMYNADGTMKNGADFGNLLGGKKKRKNNKKT